MTESPADRRRRLQKIGVALATSMPEAQMELNHRSPWELLIATILSAQCTDLRVNQVTPALFARYPEVDALARAKLSDVEPIIKSTGFFKSKARSIVACSHALVSSHAGKVPETIEELVALPGVGRKTANVLLGNAFGRPAIVVDTHVRRVANRLGLTGSDEPDRIEEDLQQLLPPAQWTDVSQRLLLHGRYTCLARVPQCDRCAIYEWCPSKEKRPR